MAEKDSSGTKRYPTAIEGPDGRRVVTNGSSASVAPSDHLAERLESALGEDAGVVLNDCVDPDALDALFADKEDGSARSSGSVSFTYRGLFVTVHSNGAVDLRPLD